MDYDELKQKSKPELNALAKAKRLKYSHQMRKDNLIRALILIEEFPTGWEDLNLDELCHWLENIEGFDEGRKLEFNLLMRNIDCLSKRNKPKRCVHGKIKVICRACDGCRICPHNKRKETCRICQPSSFCPHNRMKAFCKDCGGRNICPHGKQKAFCRPCEGTQICWHDRYKSICEECRE